MEPQLIDYYNDEPHMVHVIEKLNEEFEEAQSQIKELKLQLEKEKRNSSKMIAFTRPPCIEDEECDLEAFEEDIRGKFLEICKNDIDDYEPLSYKLMHDYNRYYSINKDSLIKYIINKLNEYTHSQNPKWCEFFILTTLEAYGINHTFSYWGAPMFEVENLLKTLSECDLTLISLGPFEN